MSAQARTPREPDPFACLSTIETYLGRAVDSLGAPSNLAEALSYAVFSGGKRLRPVLAWHSCAAVGAGAAQECLPAAAAVEFVHTFSLVHDDLPAMDDDDLRRGRPTLHVHAGEAMAILAGDALLAGAFGLLARVADPALGFALTGELATGTTGMIAGQVHDTAGGYPPGLDDPARLALVHRSKTGALIRAACRMGAMCGLAGVSDRRKASTALDAVTAYAEAIGLMFQIVDDLLDVEQTAEHAGKRTRKDAGAGKLTYPGVFGVAKSREEIARLEGEALRSIEPLGGPAEPLRVLCRHLARRTR